MILVNARNGIEITDNAKTATSFLDRLLGLINPYNPRSLILETRFGIHTFFLIQPIDVLVLDENNRIKVMRESLSPFRFFFYNPKYFKVVELPTGTIQNSQLLLSDKILFA